jgi:ribonuclease HI
MPNSSHWPRAEPIEVADTHDEATASNERRLDVPDWIRSLRDIHFARAHVDDPEEGAIISVCVWFVHGHTEESCLHPKVVRLDADQFSWRSTMVVAWLDSIRRAQPIDFHVVTPLPPDVHGTSPDVHVILSQQLFADQRAILVTAGIPDTEFPGKQRAAIVTGQVAAMDIRSVMPSALRTFGILQVSQGDHVFPEEQSFRVANGDSFVLSIAPVGSGRAGQAPPALPDEEVEDETLMLQLATFLGPVEPKADPTPAFHVSPPSLVAGDLSSKVVLSLDACVAVPATYRPDAFHGAEIAYCTRDDWPNQIAGTQIQLSSLPEGLDLTAHTLFAMSCPEHSCEPELAHKVALYVDGSVCAGHAAWSVVAVRYDAVGAPALQGCLSGTVPTSTECPQWIGAQSEDNISAELTAVVAAMVAAFCMDSGESIVVRPDLKLSVKLATFEWQCSAHPELGRLCQVLGAWFYKIHGSFCEVRGHTKHPWNDLADSLARWSAMSQLQCVTLTGYLFMS